MNKKINQVKMKSVMLFILLITGLPIFSQMSYQEFKATYKPTYKKILPNATVVQNFNKEKADIGALALEMLLEKVKKNSDEDAKLKIVAVITSCDKNKLAEILKEMSVENAVKALNIVKEEWILEALWFVDEITYHNLAPNLTALKNWKGYEGMFGPYNAKWSPVYAGIAYDRAWGGYAGINHYIDQYNSSPNKLAPDNSPVLLSEEINTMGTGSGIGVFGAFHKHNKKIIEFNFQYRGATSTGGGTSPDWSRTFRFTSSTFSILALKSKSPSYKMFKTARGWGLHGQMGGLKTKNSFTNEYENIVKGTSAGVSYNYGLYINPSKKLPVMLGIRAYAQFNVLKYDFTPMQENNPQPNVDPKTMSSATNVVNTYGLQFQAIYKFGIKDKVSNYPTYKEELVNKMDKSVNTVYSEISPTISPDGKTLYFTRADHPLNTKGSYSSQDIWVADISEGIDVARAQHMDYPFNQQTYNSVTGVSPDENTMMIKGYYENGVYAKKGYSFVYRTRDGWSKPQGIDIKGYENMTKGNYVGSYWSQDGKTLLLSFSESSTDDNQSIYFSQLLSDGTWSKPKNLGPVINTKGNDIHSPFLASDGKTLYFSSDRKGGEGSNDIWMSKRLDDTWTNWSEPENLGPEINTSKWDAYYSIDASGKYAYMVSSENSVGKSDIIRIKLKEEVQPDPVVLIKGRVLNAKTNEPIEGTIAYNGLVDGKNYGIARTNPTTGEYKIVLPYGVNYDFSANAPDFLGVSDNLDLTKVGKYEEIQRDLYLVPIEVGSTVRLNNIFFETGSAQLQEASYSELKRVAEFMKNNPTVKIELGGHTDNVGSDAANNKLSQDRVNSVMAYLKEQDVPEDRMVAKGYGKTKPVESNDTDEGRQKNRRVEFVILEK